MDKLFLDERYDFGDMFSDGGEDNSAAAAAGGGSTNLSMGLRRKSVYMDDLLVFFALESLGTLAIVGNCCLVVVLMKNRYLQRASFVLMLSLALADILHGIVTTTFFYPPILLRRVVVPPIGVRIFNILDWTAWSITLTHMSAICLDRLLAITLYGQYSQLITVRRAKLFTVTCWTAFSALNVVYILARFCCLISPLAESHFYSFGYGEFESQYERVHSALSGANMFKLTYTPLELGTLAVLSISNPITLIQLYRRHKRKMALKIRHSASASKSVGGSEAMIRRASTMLLEISVHTDNAKSGWTLSPSSRAGREASTVAVSSSSSPSLPMVHGDTGGCAFGRVGCLMFGKGRRCGGGGGDTSCGSHTVVPVQAPEVTTTVGPQCSGKAAAVGGAMQKTTPEGTTTPVSQSQSLKLTAKECRGMKSTRVRFVQ
uniref:G_PROTEIN_RECEP_F1_2 domain-containing protein n=1 Tax=Globodera pallida TaxID=36090 RepID=A0A183CL33_GLOPA